MKEKDIGAESVECAEVVYRALKKSWARGERIPREASMRRVSEPEPEPDVSLSRRKYTTARECRLKLRNMPCAASLHVGSIRDLQFKLDVLPDPEYDQDGNVTDPGHCLLANLPHPVNEEEQAEAVATQLSRIARYVTAEQEEQEHRDRRGSSSIA